MLFRSRNDDVARPSFELTSLLHLFSSVISLSRPAAALSRVYTRYTLEMTDQLFTSYSARRLEKYFRPSLSLSTCHGCGYRAPRARELVNPIFLAGFGTREREANGYRRYESFIYRGVGLSPFFSSLFSLSRSLSSSPRLRPR